MRENVDDNFTLFLRTKFRNFQNENVPRWMKPVLLFSDKHRHIFKGFSYQYFRRKSSNVFSCVGILRYLIQTIPLTPELKTIYRRHKINIDFTVSL